MDDKICIIKIFERDCLSFYETQQKWGQLYNKEYKESPMKWKHCRMQGFRMFVSKIYAV
jgi:hypothetical protein